MSKEIIKLDKIDVTFRQKKREITAVKDVSIHINQGEIYGIVQEKQTFHQEQVQ